MFKYFWLVVFGIILLYWFLYSLCDIVITLRLHDNLEESTIVFISTCISALTVVSMFLFFFD